MELDDNNDDNPKESKKRNDYDEDFVLNDLTAEKIAAAIKMKDFRARNRDQNNEEEVTAQKLAAAIRRKDLRARQRDKKSEEEVLAEKLAAAIHMKDLRARKRDEKSEEEVLAEKLATAISQRLRRAKNKKDANEAEYANKNEDEDIFQNMLDAIEDPSQGIYKGDLFEHCSKQLSHEYMLNNICAICDCESVQYDVLYEEITELLIQVDR